jgi:hypothetical protein
MSVPVVGRWGGGGRGGGDGIYLMPEGTGVVARVCFTTCGTFFYNKHFIEKLTTNAVKTSTLEMFKVWRACKSRHS